MIEKPAFRSQKYAKTFQDASVVEVYHQRPPYPDAVFEKLSDLIDPSIDAMLDVGTGLGDIARPMASRVGKVDALDFSDRMLERARKLPGGDLPNLTWIASPVEVAPVNGPYGLITAASCLHWFDLNVVIPFFASHLSPAGYLALIDRSWRTGIDDGPIIGEYSANQDYVAWDAVKAVEEAGLFVTSERTATELDWCPTVEEYLACRHSQNGLSVERMGNERSRTFDELVVARIEHQVAEGTVEIVDGRIQGTCRGSIVWGKPVGSR